MITTCIGARMPILRSQGVGSTGLAAFHTALLALGFGHYNLVRLTSVVPPGTTIDGSGTAPAPTGGWGDRLYCVFAEQRASLPGEEAWAGIGWVYRQDTAGGGLLVEHEGPTEEGVARSIRTTLTAMAHASPGSYSEPEYVLSGARCEDQPVCALVVAPFEVAPWGPGGGA